MDGCMAFVVDGSDQGPAAWAGEERTRECGDWARAVRPDGLRTGGS
jgi:hypothetical protein